jgi:hypothetical protein
MTYDEPMFAKFTRKAYELPYSYYNTVQYSSNLIDRHIKVSSKVTELGKGLVDVRAIRICSPIVNLATNAPGIRSLSSPMGCNGHLDDLDECTELIQVLEKD